MRIKFICLIFITLFSCSEDFSSEQLVKFEVSQKYSVDLSKVGLSSQLEFPVAISESDPNRFFIFNSFARTIDTVSINEDILSVSKGVEIPFEGPNGVESFNYFIEYENNFIFLDHNSVYIPNSFQIKRIQFSKLPFAFDEKLEYVTRGNSISDGFNFLNYKNSKIYLFFETFDGFNKKLVSFDFINSDMKLIEFKLIDEFEDHIISFKEGSFLAQNPYLPMIKVEQDFLIISYPFSSKFHKYQLINSSIQDFSPTSKLFNSEKTKPNKNFDTSSFNDFKSESDKWQDDVRFGSFFKLQDELFYRIVKGRKDGDKSSKFIEVFDFNLNKIGEADLSSIQPDLGAMSVPIGGKIFVKSKVQKSEDIMDYYLITISKY